MSPTNATLTLEQRPLRPSDDVAVYELTRASELHETGTSLIELDDVRGDWARPSYDLGRQTTGFFEDGVLVAYGEVHRKRSESYVHPDHYGRGIGTSLLRWSIDKARELGYDRIGQTVPTTNVAACELFRRFGYSVLYTSWILEMASDATVHTGRVDERFQVRSFDPERETEVVFQTLEDAFNEWPDREPSTFEDWSAATFSREDYAPWQILVAVDTTDAAQQVVGACMVSVTEDEGWVNQIAVRRDARGHGLGRALLATAFDVAREHGASRTRLNTDTRTGALGLYEHVGMTIAETYEHYSLRLTTPDES